MSVKIFSFPLFLAYKSAYISELVNATFPSFCGAMSHFTYNLKMLKLYSHLESMKFQSDQSPFQIT